jgi:uncharacterized protein (TIGR03089 family)
MADETIEGLFSARVAADPTRPLVTFYDDATGERAELSAKSLANWVAKTHFLLLDEIGLGVGDKAFVSLPLHWLAAPVLLGCWFAGLEVVTDPAGAAVAFGDVDALQSIDLGAVSDLYAVSLLSMARSAEPPAGMTDYAAAVRPQPDSWPTVRAQASPDDLALDGRSRTELAGDARVAANALGLVNGGRLLWSGSADWLPALLAPIAVGGSVVLVRNPDPARIQSHADAEQATVRA